MTSPSLASSPSDLKRTMQRRVLDVLAMRVLQGDFIEGDTILAGAGADGLRLRKAFTSDGVAGPLSLGPNAEAPQIRDPILLATH